MNHKTKILIATPLYPPDIGGPATYSKALFDNLPNYEFDVQILNFGRVRHLAKWIRHFYYLVLCLKNGLNNDIIFAQDPLSVGVPAAIAAFVLRKPFVLKIVGDYAWEQAVQQYGTAELLDDFLIKKYHFGIEKFRWLERFAAHRAKLVIVPSEYLKTVVERWGIDPTKIHAIHNDVSLPSTLLSRAVARQTLNFTDKNTVFVSVGRLVPWKGFDTLIFCMAKVVDQHKDARLLIIGDGPQYSYLRDTIYSLGLENNIYLLGKLSHDAVIKYLSAADIFLLNTGYEGFSHQLLEAFALGVPTITTLCGGNAEIVRANANALVVAYNDRKGWENAMLTLYNDKELMTRLGQLAKESARKYSEGSMIAQTSTVLKKI